MSDGVSTLDEFNSRYKEWVTNGKISQGSAGSCNANSLYTTPTVIDGTDPKRVKDYYLCGSGDHYHCKGLDWPQWDSIWGNCKMTYSGDRYDKCDNMATQTTDGLTGHNRFNMAIGSGVTTTYDPVSDTISGAGGCTTFPLSTDCKIGNVNGQRPAYPNNKTVINQVMPEETNAAQMSINDAYYTDGLEGCPTGISRELICALDGRDNTENTADGHQIPSPGCGFGSDDGNENLGKFCARDSSDYSDENIAQCCLGSLANGPEVDTSGNPISNDYRNCPREFCTSRIAEGTGGGGGTNCDNPVTDGTDASGQPEIYCNKMSNTCDQFFHDKCTEVIFNDETNELHQYCKDWGHIQPDSFRTIAHEICNIGDFSGTARPSQDEVSHVKQVMDTPLCREYILENLQTEKTKLKDLCSHYIIKNDQDEWVPNVLLNVDGEDLLQNICPCYYPDEFYNSYRSSLNREVGTCSDPDGHVDSTIRSRQECENKEGENTWDTDAGQSNLVAAIDDRMAIHPECYYPECTSSLLYNIEGSSCSMNLNLCYQQLIQQNIILGDDKIDTSNVDLTSGEAHQTCNQSSLLSDPPSSDSGGGDEGEGLFSGLGSFLGGDDDGGGSGSGGGDNSTMIIIIVIVIIIIIIGVVAVIMLNKGDPNPPAQIQQPPSQ
jgi:hypothetical protein